MITETLIFRVVNGLYLFLMVNLYFVLSNALFFFVFLSVDLKFETMSLVFISLIPMGPALGAVFSIMGKWIREQDIYPIRDYFKGYKQNFRIALGYGCSQLGLLFILLVNIRSGKLPILLPFFMLLFLFVLSLNLYAFPILSRFEIKWKDLWIISAYYFFKYWKLSMLNLTTVVSFGLLYAQFPLVASLFLSSVIPYFIMFNLRNLLREMEAGRS